MQRDQYALIDLLIDRFETVVVQLAFCGTCWAIIAMNVAD
jgi:hypothetical protein